MMWASTVLLAVGLQAAIASLPDSVIAEAITAGQQKRSLILRKGNESFEIFVDGPFSRIAGAATKAAELSQSFTVADVPSAMSAETVVVRVFPTRPSMDGREVVTGPSAVRVILRQQSTNLQPLVAEPFEWTFQHVGGASLTKQGQIASFPLSQLGPDAFDVLVTDTDGAEHRFRFSSGERKSLR